MRHASKTPEKCLMKETLCGFIYNIYIYIYIFIYKLYIIYNIYNIYIYIKIAVNFLVTRFLRFNLDGRWSLSGLILSFFNYAPKETKLLWK